MSKYNPQTRHYEKSIKSHRCEGGCGSMIKKQTVSSYFRMADGRKLRVHKECELN